MNMQALLAGALALIVTGGAVAQPDGWIERANTEIALVPGHKSIEQSLFPVLAAMDPVPGLEDDDSGDAAGFFLLEGCKTLAPGQDGWGELAAWAQADAQRAVLEVIEQIGDPDQRWMVSVPFGRDAVETAWADQGLFIELGPGGLLAGADYRYLAALVQAHALVTVEANRLLEAGEGDEGLERYADLLWLYRYIADRDTVGEKQAAMMLMEQTCGQMRDLAWRGVKQKAMTGDGIAAVVKSMEERELYLMRIRPPTLERLVVEQLIERTLGGAGGADGFAVDMARATSAEQPLMLFNETAKWREVASEHAGARETLRQLDMVIGDYSTRWTFPFWDPLLQLPTDFQKMDHRRFAAIVALAGEMGGLLPMRRALVVELAGTRCALAGAGYQLDREAPAHDIVQLQPNYVPSLRRNLDAYSYNEREKALDELLYFVPGTGRRVEVEGRPGIHEIAMPGDGGGFNESSGPSIEEVIAMARGAMQQMGASEQELAQIDDLIRDPERMADEIEKELNGPNAELVREIYGGFGAIKSDGSLDRQVVIDLLSVLEDTPTTDGETFEVDRNDFVLYSVGEDGQDNGATSYNEDLIFWPPVFSMMRELMSP